MEQLRILVADYDDASREALGTEIRSEAGLHLCGTTNSGIELLELIHKEKRDGFGSALDGRHECDGSTAEGYCNGYEAYDYCINENQQ